jgi:purine nucleosidase
MNWVIDTDAGVDDALGIALLFAQSRTDLPKLLAITTVAGNCSRDKVDRNVPAILDALGAATPFFAGCDRPLIEPYQDAADFHGEDGLGDAGLGVSTRIPEREHGALALVRLAREHAGNLTVVALGPLTNIALACNLDPAFAKNVSQLVVMGGAWRAQGNQTSAGEFNIVVDPESARVVFDRFTDVLMLPWEVCLEQPMPFETLAALATRGTPRASFYARMTRAGSINLRERFGLQGFPLPDPLAIAAALDPSLITRELKARVKVDIGRDVGRALTTLDFRAPKPNARVIVAMDYARANAMIEAALI